jgi:hypothetical protein
MTCYNVILLLVVMTGSGLLGGAANHLLLQQDDPENAKRSRSFILGLVASFVVPLLLRTVSSDLIDKITSIRYGSGLPFDFFVFTSFCLVAAVLSRTFVETVSKRLLAEVERAKRESKEAKTQAVIAEERVSQAEPVLRKAMDELSEPQPTAARMVVSPALQTEDLPVDRTDQEILTTLTSDQYSYRTTGSIAAEVQGTEPDIGKRLERMREHALAGKWNTPTRTLWFLTNKGHNLLATKGVNTDPSRHRDAM